MAKDLDLFKAAMADVRPLRGRPRPVVAKPQGERPVKPRERAPAPAAIIKSHAPQTFDRDVDRALSRGRRAPQAKLDLHGMTLAAAEKAVAQFLAESSEQGRRLVLIVTGKGLRLAGGRVFGGRIRAEFPGWLESADNRARVAAVRVAHPRHGGTGAFYILLRRRRVHA